jgi:hypothetical protein
MKPLRIAAALGWFVALSPAAAQQTPDMIPRDVVMAILRNGPPQGGEPAIMLGDRLPDNLVNKVSLPPGAHVVATLESWSNTDVIGTAPQLPDSVRVWFAAEFMRRGYEPQEVAGRRAAFRAAEGSVTGGFCGAGAFFSVSARPRPGGKSEFLLRTRQMPQSCSQTFSYGLGMGGNWSTSGFNPPALPLLVNPKSAEEAPRCNDQMNTSSATARSTISVSAAPDQLLALYGKQLDSAGWKRETITTGAVGTWTRRDSTGRDVRVQITALPSSAGADCRSITMTATGAQP